MRLPILLVSLLLAGCATPGAPPIEPPPWPAIPPGVLDAFCSRLQMDAIATGSPLAIVRTTSSLATPQSMSALALTATGRVTNRRVGQSAAEMNRAIPIITEGSACQWKPFAAEHLHNVRDEMVVELSAPGLNPYSAREGGLFARVSVGGQAASWYWLSLYPRGERWVVGGVFVLVQ